ncbi:MAG: phosphoglycerate kinase [Phycisphaerae bacterium]|jgi:phosphoglycerate kinase
MAKTSVRQLAVSGLRVLVRADFNVPLDGQQRITDDLRIRQFLPTLEDLVRRGARVVLMSHLGRPTGDPAQDRRLSLRPVAHQLRELTGRPCCFASDCVGAEAVAASRALTDGQTLLLENLRFHEAETIIDKAKKNPDGKLTAEQEQKRAEFARGLVALADLYVNDAFGTCHRPHVSMYDVPAALGAGKRAVGFLIEKEIKYLGDALQSPRHPFVAILGGAKVSDKIGVIRNLLKTVDRVLVGGAMMFTFWAAQNRSVGRSLCERDKLDLARELIQQGGDKLVLPVDCVAAAELKPDAATRVVEGEVPADLMGLDIGPRTRELFARHIGTAATIVWNGPLGAFETRPFYHGTYAAAKAIADATERGAISVIAGGDSAAAVEQARQANRVSHISTGGGASLEFLEGRRFASLDIIDDA